MIRIMIVDDEPLIRQWLIMCLKNMGIQDHMIDQAANGEEAIAFLDEYVYDLIFTDITMPKLDGISLIKTIRQRDSNVTLIIITCHDNFEFARSAIKYNVYEYLMKNELDQKDIEKIVIRFLKPILEQKENKIIRNNFMNHLLCDKNINRVNSEELKKNFIPLSDSPCFAIALDCHEPNICDSFMDNEFIYNPFSFYDENHLTILISNLKDEKEYSDILNDMTNKILRPWNNKKHIGASKLYDSSLTLPIMIREAADKWEFSFFSYNSNVSFNKHNVKYSSNIDFKNIIQEEKNKALLIFSTMGIKACKRQSLNLCNLFVEHKVFDSNLLKRTITEIIEKIDNIIPERTKSLNYDMGRIINTSYFSELTDYLNEFFDSIPDSYNSQSIIKEAQEYILLHYNEPITLKYLAHRAFLSEEYFSRLFKKETGKTFTDYLMGIRMDRAHMLLSNSDFNINEIAEMVGFPNPSYFSSQFKKYYKISPKDIRK